MSHNLKIRKIIITILLSIITLGIGLVVKGLVQSKFSKKDKLGLEHIEFEQRNINFDSLRKSGNKKLNNIGLSESSSISEIENKEIELIEIFNQQILKNESILSLLKEHKINTLDFAECQYHEFMRLLKIKNQLFKKGDGLKLKRITIDSCLSKLVLKQ